MKLIPRTVHGVLDYVVGLLLIGSPWLFGFADDTAAMYIPALLGLGAMFYSLFTDYEMGLVRVLPFSVHLLLDVSSGVFLAASPWLFGFADRIVVPHVVLGLFEMIAAVLTRNPEPAGQPTRKPFNARLP